MERVTISMSHELAAEPAAFMAGHGDQNRSEALRDLARRGLERARLDGVPAGNAPQPRPTSSTTIAATRRSA